MTSGARWTIGLLILGVAIRLAVYGTIPAIGVDPHFEYVQYVHQNHHAPHSHELGQSHHPPLYYVIGALLYEVGGVSAVHLFSLLLSVAALVIMVRLIERHVGDIIDRRVCILFACCYPLLVLSSNYISNDPLAILAGTLVFVAVDALLRRPGALGFAALGGALGLSLATKLTLVGALPVCLLLVARLAHARTRDLARTAAWVAVVGLIAVSLGSHKLIDNTVMYGSPIISNLAFDPEWADDQRPTFVSVPEYLDPNIFKLLEHEVYEEEVTHSAVLILYETSWYLLVEDLARFLDERGWKSLLRGFVYLVPVPFVLTCLLGLGAVLFGIPVALDDHALHARIGRSRLFVLVVTLVWLTLLGLVIAVGVHYDAWSCFQTRLLLPAFLAIPLLLAAGMAVIRRFSDRAARAVALLVALQCLGYAVAMFMDLVLYSRQA